jgi:Uma2 family endonuclease
MRRFLEWVDAGPPESDPYLYGLREVRAEHPDGSETLDAVPLTLEDVLFPKVGDFISNGDWHVTDLAYLRGVFEWQLREDPSAKVLTRCGVDWNLPGIRPVCPDTVVFTGVKRRINWSIFDVAVEGAQPQLVIEVTIPWTRQLDLGPKLEIYHRAKIPFYLIADNPRWEERRPLELIGYRYARRAYRRVAPDQYERIRLEAVRLDVGLQCHPRGGYQRLSCFDLETGREYGDYSEESEWLAAAEAKVEMLTRKRESRI